MRLSYLIAAALAVIFTSAKPDKPLTRPEIREKVVSKTQVPVALRSLTAT